MQHAHLMVHGLAIAPCALQSSAPSLPHPESRHKCLEVAALLLLGVAVQYILRRMRRSLSAWSYTTLTLGWSFLYFAQVASQGTGVVSINSVYMAM
jgi:hypothetical protein